MQNSPNSPASPISRLREYWNVSNTHYARDIRRMRMLEGADQGDLWKVLNAKFPSFQILPDTNFISYIKNNQLASLYTTTKSAELVPTSEEDAELITTLNVVLENMWDLENIGYYEFKAGERAALLNLGITQVGWSEDFVAGKGDSFRKGRVTFKNIDPMRFRRDPFAQDLDSAKWCCTYEDLHESVLFRNPKYKEAIKASSNPFESSEVSTGYFNERPLGADSKYHRLFIYWERQDDNTINEYHILNNKLLLLEKIDIKPSAFPFALLYNNEPSASLIGVSECAKIFANSVAYNMLQSIALTAEYKNQCPPKFISTQSGLNVSSFAKHGDEAGRTFIVQGDASKAVHYHQFPPISATLPTQMQTLTNNIHDVSGVDNRYTGRDTGSIITTGGTQEMLNRVTLIDAPKIILYENYTKKLTDLILKNLLEYSPERWYYVKDPKDISAYKTVKVEFPHIDKDTLFQYVVQISSELPKNKQRVQAWADTIMEKQMQYRQAGDNVDLITEEEWLRMQDIPYKEQMMTRMGFQKRTDALQEAGQVVYEYGQMVDAGVQPEDALVNAAQGLLNKRSGEPTPLEASTVQTPQESLTPTDLLGSEVT